MKNIKTLIEREFDAFFEFETDNRDVVTSTSAKLFAEHVVGIATAPESPAVQVEPVGEAGSLPGAKGFTTAVFDSKKVPKGTKLYTVPQPSPDVSELVEALEEARETIAYALHENASEYFATDADIARYVVIQRIDAALAAHRKQGVRHD